MLSCQLHAPRAKSNVHNKNDDVISITHASVDFRHPIDHPVINFLRESRLLTVMCLNNTSTEVVLPLSSATMGDSYSSDCGAVAKSFDGNIADKECECALSAVAETPSNTKNYWWRGVLTNVSRVRAIHVWARKGESSIDHMYMQL